LKRAIVTGIAFFYNKQLLKLYCLPLEYGTQKTVSPHQNLPGLRPPFYLAKEMGESLGRGEVLQRQVQEANKEGEQVKTMVAVTVLNHHSQYLGYAVFTYCMWE